MMAKKHYRELLAPAAQREPIPYNEMMKKVIEEGKIYLVAPNHADAGTAKHRAFRLFVKALLTCAIADKANKEYGKSDTEIVLNPVGPYNNDHWDLLDPRIFRHIFL